MGTLIAVFLVGVACGRLLESALRTLHALKRG